MVPTEIAKFGPGGVFQREIPGSPFSESLILKLGRGAWKLKKSEFQRVYAVSESDEIDEIPVLGGFPLILFDLRR